MAGTLAQLSNVIGFPKAGELIEITGAHALTSSDRAILNLLYQHAHDSGRIAEENAEWEIPISSLVYRPRFLGHRVEAYAALASG